MTLEIGSGLLVPPVGMVHEYKYTHIIIWMLGCLIDDWVTCAFFSWTSYLWRMSLGIGAIKAMPFLCFLKYIYYVAVF